VIETTRRSLITGLIALVAAPAIVRAGSLMPVKAMPLDGPVSLAPREWIDFAHWRIPVKIDQDGQITFGKWIPIEPGGWIPVRMETVLLNVEGTRLGH
jgi:hypothetical protein